MVVAPEDLVEELASLFAHRDRYEARVAQLLHRIGETEAFSRDGYSSLTAMLKHRMSLHPGEAQRLVARANGLANTPLVALAYARGAISGAQVDVLLETRSTALEAFTEAEGFLVEIALDTPLVRDLRKHLDYWLDRVAPIDLGMDRNLVRDLRSLTLRRDGDMMRINGWVDIEAGERLRAELEPGPPAEGDTRPTPARRADVLMDILNGASHRPDITVHVAAETLIQSGPGISETSNGTFLTTAEVKRLCCEANLTRVIFGPESQPLDVGRTKRLVTPALRAAVCARDLRCVFPGCDRPSHRGKANVHHLTHWADGGETSIDNLVLLCRHHHVLIHEGGWALTGTPGDLRFLSPGWHRVGRRATAPTPVSRPLQRPGPIRRHPSRRLSRRNPPGSGLCRSVATADPLG
ncbi:MAG TPA: DUF222 domain-containing protein [Acidimicrobiia bacterium]|nr:DUF222 domain-containing protein [Acidimicrobiia bacterium]